MDTLSDIKTHMTELEMEFATWLKDRREAKGISIRQLARDLDRSQTMLANIERGLKPSVNIVKELAEYFKVDESYLFVLARIMDGNEQVKGNIIETIAFETNELPPAIQQEILDYVRLRKGKGS